jgi:hypothetical protein
MVSCNIILWLQYMEIMYNLWLNVLYIYDIFNRKYIVKVLYIDLYIYIFIYRQINPITIFSINFISIYYQSQLHIFYINTIYNVYIINK